jgi:demethylmenaquinone methyltransferase/2-methoxy-6-polyprenyl-1,4-benzoquinol methylase
MKPYADNDPKGGQVRRMFDFIAPRYDMLNRLLSLGIDQGWRRRAVRCVVRHMDGNEASVGNPGILDVATGTGDMAIELARAMPRARITGVDISEGMLAVGREKIARARFSDRATLVRGDAAGLASEGFDIVTAAFGVRNFEDLQKGIEGMRRALRPGGMIAILEFSTPRNRLFGALYRFYFHRVLPLVGGWVSGDGKAYRYLPLSVEEFPSPDDFLRLLENNGFADCRASPLTFGVAQLYIGFARDDNSPI